jgi:hypothetical protein
MYPFSARHPPLGKVYSGTPPHSSPRAVSRAESKVESKKFIQIHENRILKIKDISIATRQSNTIEYRLSTRSGDFFAGIGKYESDKVSQIFGSEPEAIEGFDKLKSILCSTL